MPFGLWTWQSGKLVADPEPWFAPRCRIFPEYGGAYLWAPDGASDLCEGYTEDLKAAERLDQDFDEWARLWEVIDIDDFSAGAAPEGGWDAFDTQGIELCRRLITLMGSDGLVVYTRDGFCSVPRMGPLLLYWEEVRKRKTRPCDPVRYLTNEEAIAAYLQAAVDDGDAQLTALANKHAGRARKRLDAYRVSLPEEDVEVEHLYAERFGSIPVGLWHGKEARRQALEQARLVLAGKRGPIRSEEFPVDCPPEAIL
ncbi:hypothetical protein [Holophaga foetida]|uniref:hypothetical protein n=1 Tax=Holophaga foetida TaxID=35839 RepID=UPI0011DC757F|nr:hypothetical protein [Holophaga foetida]